MNQDEFDNMIGRLDRVLSEMMLATKVEDLDTANWQTLKHHGEDMKLAGEAILKRYEALKSR